MQESEKKSPHKGVYILPNLFTSASLFAGFFAIILASKGNFEGAAAAIFFAALMDGLDGRVARLTNTASEFGVQYDSLADLVSFGAAPACLAYFWFLGDFGRTGVAVAFLFLVCGALRLARFNVMTASISNKFFIGLPIPAAGCTLSSLVFVQSYLPDLFLNALPGFTLVLTVILALCMVSRIRYTSFKDYGMFKTHPFSSMTTAIFLFVLLLSEPKLLSFCMLILYVISGIIYTYIIMPKRNSTLLRNLGASGKH
ncbi:CDP-diacylglycerol--serine O-phosphatidyltransferase [Desulfovibrio litoralis]|uniref:CDP-diacylglycerol--serine O-phosphatidyltransferase n=1 Tax=Desulfovibrio litoralis DSM 11393 TaxID=1121455 RepID=A0A1M7SQI6_9BACT|nr:CDP-diacylglycerol--serine O-phosphatidyltransferase [Desulfovibrio litoralis]SHN60783.1 CDP-diacylglycerol--serine O-phosphatidyltransferase [Desulfovibrio litoralis DSM 11393]